MRYQVAKVRAELSLPNWTGVVAPSSHNSKVLLVFNLIEQTFPLWSFNNKICSWSASGAVAI